MYIQNGLECTAVTELNISSTGWEYLLNTYLEVFEGKPQSKNIRYAMSTELPVILLKI